MQQSRTETQRKDAHPPKAAHPAKEDPPKGHTSKHKAEKEPAAKEPSPSKATPKKEPAGKQPSAIEARVPKEVPGPEQASTKPVKAEAHHSKEGPGDEQAPKKPPRHEEPVQEAKTKESSSESEKPKVFPSSKIIKDRTSETTLVTWLRETMNAEVGATLLWQGSRDGFTAQMFHRLCDGQAPTLMVIESAKDQVFGGFTSIPWTSDRAGVWVADQSAFVFSLTRKTKHATQNNPRSVYHEGKVGPIFGASDIWVFDKCHEKDSCSSYPGSTYQLPPSADRDSYLAGSLYFSTKEIEIFSVFPLPHPLPPPPQPPEKKTA
jgi:hypothetical protein